MAQKKNYTEEQVFHTAVIRKINVIDSEFTMTPDKETQI